MAQRKVNPSELMSKLIADKYGDQFRHGEEICIVLDNDTANGGFKATHSTPVELDESTPVLPNAVAHFELALLEQEYPMNRSKPIPPFSKWVMSVTARQFPDGAWALDINMVGDEWLHDCTLPDPVQAQAFQERLAGLRAQRREAIAA